MNETPLKREHHIKLPSFKMINYFGAAILAGLAVSGVYIVNNINQEFAIRKLAGKFQEYKYATLSFNNVYSGLPGDITNATFYWKEFVKDGNGDKMITQESGEGIAAWQQLQLANLLKFSYTLTGKWNEKAGEGVLIPEENIPSGTDKADGFYINYSEELQTTVFGFGAASSEKGLFAKPALTPNDAYNLDLMIDDGYPDKGNLTATSHDNSSDCFAVGEYKKESEVKECILLFKL